MAQPTYLRHDVAEGEYEERKKRARSRAEGEEKERERAGETSHAEGKEKNRETEGKKDGRLTGSLPSQERKRERERETLILPFHLFVCTSCEFFKF